MLGRLVPGPCRRQIATDLATFFDENELAQLLLALDERYELHTSRWQGYAANVHTLVSAANRNGWLIRLVRQAAQDRPGPKFPFEGMLSRLTAVSDHLKVLVTALGPRGEPIAVAARERLADLAITLIQLPGDDRSHRAARAAIDGSDAVALVMAAPREAEEWLYRYTLDRAVDLGSDVIVLRTASANVVPLPEETLDVPIDGAEDGWGRFEGHLAFLASPEGLLRALRRRRDRLTALLADAKVSQTRAEAEMQDYDIRIALQVRRAEDPAAARHASEESIERGLERAKRPGAGQRRATTVDFVNEPPAEPPAFRDREDKLSVVERLLSDPTIRLITVTGRDGIGKTGLVSRLWNRLGGTDSPVAVDGLIYLPAHGSLPITATALLQALASVTPLVMRKRAEEGVRLPVPLPDKAHDVVTALDGRTVVVVLDNAEDLLDDGGDLHDPDLRAVVRHLVRHRSPWVRLLLVSQRPPTVLLSGLPVDAVRPEPLDGLNREETHALLCALDAGHDFDFDAASEREKDSLYHLTGGTPRAVELAFAVLRARPEKPLAWLLDEMRNRTEPDVVKFLFGEVFSQLARDQRPVVEALAVYARPVDAAAVDTLLQRYVDASASQPILESLCGRRLIRRYGDRFHLPYHPDGELVLGTLPTGGPNDRVRNFRQLTQVTLLFLAAEHFRAARVPEHSITRVDHLDAQFSEIDLRIRCGEYDEAQALIEEIDDHYLHRWGYSESVVPMLKTLAGVVAGDRLGVARVMSRLSDAYRQREQPSLAIDSATKGLSLLSPLRDAAYHAALNGQVGAALLDQREIPAATARYRKALFRAVSGREPYEAAKACGGLLLCHGRSGRLGLALRCGKRAVRLARRGVPGDPDSVEPRAWLNMAWVYSQLGRHGLAWWALRSALGGATDQRHRLLEGHALVLRAELLIDESAFSTAAVAAGTAAEIGVRTDSGWMCRSAQEILTIAALCRDDLDGARMAVDVPGRTNGGVLGIGLRGIVAYRREEFEEAREAFARADEWFRESYAGTRDFQLLHWHGVVLMGLALADEGRRASHLAGAENTLRRARDLAPDAHGAVRRTLQLLNQLTIGADPAMIDLARGAVGRTEPSISRRRHR